MDILKNLNFVPMDNLAQDEDVNQVMIVDSSMETADESSVSFC